MIFKRFGTDYGGWFIPSDIQIERVYSFGVGEDMSFDLELQEHTDANIWMFDPTPRAVQHVREIQKGQKPSSSISNHYESILNNSLINWSKIYFSDYAVAGSDGTRKAKRQKNENNVSETIIEKMYDGRQVNTYKCKTIPTLMRELDHSWVDMIKMDIEGAEIETIHTMLNHHIYPRVLCVEFDLKSKGRDKDGSTDTLIKRLNSVEYSLHYRDGWNYTFIKN